MQPLTLKWTIEQDAQNKQHSWLSWSRWGCLLDVFQMLCFFVWPSSSSICRVIVSTKWVSFHLSFAALRSFALLTCCWRGTPPCFSSTSLSVYSTSTAMRNMGSTTSFSSQRGEWEAEAIMPACPGRSSGGGCIMQRLDTDLMSAALVISFLGTMTRENLS